MSTEIRTKGDLVNDALSKMQISGITAPPDASDIALLLRKLEILMYRLLGDDLDLGYNFQQLPSTSDLHRLNFIAYDAISSLLAVNALTDYVLPVSPELDRQSSAAMSSLVGWVMKNTLRQVQYPQRHPIGSGNNVLNQWQRNFQPPPLQAPVNSYDELELGYGEINDFLEDFTDLLRAGEDLISVVVEVSSALTYTETTLTTLRLDYRLQANSVSSNQIETLKFTAATSTGRVMIINKNLKLAGIPDDTARNNGGGNMPSFPLAIADGGTGAVTDIAARLNLGLPNFGKTSAIANAPTVIDPIADERILFLMDATDGSFTQPLPPLADFPEGWEFIIQKINPSNEITIVADGTEVIADGRPLILSQGNDTVHLRQTPFRWRVIGFYRADDLTDIEVLKSDVADLKVSAQSDLQRINYSEIKPAGTAAYVLFTGQSNSDGTQNLPVNEQIATLANVFILSRATTISGSNWTDESTWVWTNFTSDGAILNLGRLQNGHRKNLTTEFARKWQFDIDNGVDLPDLYINHMSRGGSGFGRSVPTGTWFNPNEEFAADRGNLWFGTLKLANFALGNLLENHNQVINIGIVWNQWEHDSRLRGEAENYGGFLKSLLLEHDKISLMRTPFTYVVPSTPGFRNQMPEFITLQKQFDTLAGSRLITIIDPRDLPAYDVSITTPTGFYGIYHDDVHYDLVSFDGLEDQLFAKGGDRGVIITSFKEASGGGTRPSAPLAVADGGTGADTAIAARLNLGLPNFGKTSAVAGAPTVINPIADERILFLMDATGGSFTQPLPPLADFPEGWEIVIQKINPSNEITIVADGTEVIGDGTPLILSQGNDTVHLRQTSFRWRIIGFYRVDDLNDIVQNKADIESLKSQTRGLQFNGLIGNGTHIVSLRMTSAGVINRTVTVCRSGTCVATFAINGVVVGGNANAVSDTIQTQAHISNNSYDVGDSITFEVTNTASCTDMHVTMEVTE